MIKTVTLVMIAVSVSGCVSLPKDPNDNRTTEDRYAPLLTPSSSGEAESGYTYVPIDPFPVRTVMGDSCVEREQTMLPRYPFLGLLPSLPDNAVRMLVERFDQWGNVSYGISKAGLRNESYRVTVDYINADTINQRVLITKYMTINGKREIVSLLASPPHNSIKGSESYSVKPMDDFASAPGPEAEGEEFNVPVYVGVGLRVSANVYVVGASANISGIGVIGAEAEANKLNGSLVVQTLGVNGKSVAAALPIQSELNRTTAQNAIAAVGTLKALLYSEETVTSPRVVGMYMPFPGGKPLVNALISALSTSRIKWHRPCQQPTDELPTKSASLQSKE